MGSMGCRETVEWFTVAQAEDEEFRTQLRSLWRAAELDFESMAALISAREPSIGALVAEELSALPREAILAMLRAWSDAVDRGVRFRLVSEPPAAPLAFARNRRVQVVLEFEEEAIAVRLSHVPHRHPRWCGIRPTWGTAGRSRLVEVVAM